MQRGQLASADDQKWRAALQDPKWDGSPQQLLKNGLKQGVGPQSYGMMAQSLATIGQGFAKLGTDELKLQTDLADHVGDQLEAVQSAPADKKLAAQAQAKQNSLTWINSTPGIDPKVKQSMLSDINQIPDDVYVGDDHLATLIAHNKLHSGLVEDALKASQTNKNNVEAGLGQLKLNIAKNSKAGDYDSQIDQLVPPTGANAALNQQTKVMVNGALKRGDFEGAQKALDQTSQALIGMQKEGYVQGREDLRQSLNRQAMQSNELQKNGLGQLDKMFTDPTHGYTQFLAQAQSTKHDHECAERGRIRRPRSLRS